MSKFLRIDTNELSYLKRKALRDPDLVFSSPNEVLRSILGLELKKESKRSRKAKGVTKIRIDDEVLEQLKTRAKQFNMNDIKPLDKLLEKILELELEDEDENEGCPRRPALRRR
jgi:uncharacterized protein (DUF4415 family)